MLIFKIVRSQGIGFKLFFKMMGVRHGEDGSSTMKSQLKLGEQALWTPQVTLPAVFPSERSVIRHSI